jgi:hypothetical protein
MRNIFLFDTETVGLFPRNFVYDIGWVVTDRLGNITKKRNFLIKEVVTDGSKMMSAFFAKKVFSWYIPALDSGKIGIIGLDDMQQIMYNDLQTCSTVAAYNVGFDLSALRNTIDVCGGQTEILFDDFDILCLWNFACEVLLSTPAYWKAASAHGWQSRAGNFTTTAESTYRFIMDNPKFVEAHTALDDCMIENEILKACMAKRQTIPYNKYNNSPWRKAQTPQQLENMRLVRRLKQGELFEPDFGTRAA